MSSDEFPRELVKRWQDAVYVITERETLVKALKDIAAIEDNYWGTDWEEIEQARSIAIEALTHIGEKV